MWRVSFCACHCCAVFVLAQAASTIGVESAVAPSLTATHRPDAGWLGWLVGERRLSCWAVEQSHLCSWKTDAAVLAAGCRHQPSCTDRAPTVASAWPGVGVNRHFWAMLPLQV